MKNGYRVTKSERKAMVQVIGEVLGVTPVYLGVPSCTYVIGPISVNVDCEVIWDEQTDNITVQKVTEALAAAGYERKPDLIEVVVTIPTMHHTGSTLRNLVNLIYTRGPLINKALSTNFAAKQNLVDVLAETEELITIQDFCRIVADHTTELSGVSITPEEISFSTLPETDNPDMARAFTELVSMMNKQALIQKRIQAKTVNDENEKYAFRIWLMRLGMNGPEYKGTRKILLEHLSGNTAFRTSAEENKWKARQAEKRDALNAAKAEMEVETA